LYTNDTAASSPILEASTKFIDFAEHHGLALVKVHKGAKNPVGEGWQNLYSRNRADWEQWQAEGFNVGVHAGASRVVIFDLDQKHGGIEAVRTRFDAWCYARNMAPLPHHVTTPSGGQHVFMKVPQGVDATLLAPDLRGTIGKGVDVLTADRQSVAPGSFFSGTADKPAGHYAFNEAPLYPAPPSVIEFCTRTRAPESANVATPPGGYDFDAAKKLYQWLADNTVIDNDEDWRTCGMAARLEFGEQGLELWRIIAVRSGTLEPQTLARWATFVPKPNAATLKSVFDIAHKAGWKDIVPKSFAETFKDIPKQSGPGMATSERRNLRSRRKSAASFAGRQPPEREWVVPNWIPTEQVTLLYGDGAVGKSLLAMLLASSAVTGSLWFGHFVKKCPVEFITAEDSEGELHRRLADISRETRQPLENLGDLHVSSFADEDAIMAAANGDGQLVKTGFYDEVVEIVQESKPGLLVLDTLADIYGGNEIIRAQARAFVNMLRKIAIGHQLGVVVLAHPSLEGMRSGKGTSGSTGWSNSVRSRLYLSRVYDDGGREPDTDARVLTSMKMNYGSIGNEIRMRYQRGIFVPDSNSGGDPMIAASRADRVFCDLLAKARDQKLNLHATKGRGNYAPDHFRVDADKQGVKHAELVAALRRMMDDGRIENAQYGPPSRPHYRLQLKGGA
jgi:hypothetical protein